MSFSSLQSEVLQPDLCCRCGTCAAACPAGNIQFVDPKGSCLPTDSGLCREGCSLCRKVCPGIDSDLSSLYGMVEGDRALCFGLGPYSDACLLRALDDGIRERSTSGGAVTAILASCLENGIVDAVLSVGPDPEDVRASVARISRAKNELLDCSQSRYCVVPLNEALRKLDPAMRYGVVGLPCQVAGLRKLLLLRPALSDSIALVLGLFCHSTMYFEATERMLELSTSKGVQSPTKVKYRDGRFPGCFTVYWREKTEQIVTLDDLMVYFDYFALNRCRLCTDHVNVFSDISFADPFPFITELSHNDCKWTSALVRTERGKRILGEVLKNGASLIRKDVQEASVRIWDRVWRSKQWVHLLQIASDKRLGKAIPDVHSRLPEVSLPRALAQAAKAHIFHNIHLGTLEMCGRVFRMDDRARTLKRLRRMHGWKKERGSK